MTLLILSAACCSGLLECPLTTRVSKTVTKDGPFGGKSGHVNYYDPNPPANNCLKEPCGLPEDKPSTVNRPTTVGAKNMTIDWVNYCEPEPRESILHDRNPTCDLEAYVGGLQVCKHMWSLLDADQVSTAARSPSVLAALRSQTDGVVGCRRSRGRTSRSATTRSTASTSKR